jgi:hypothetical protein
MRASIFLAAMAPICIPSINAAVFNTLRTDSYDDLGPTLGVGQPPEINSDGGIAYNNFRLTSPQGGTVQQLTGTRATSPPNAAILTLPAQGSFATTGRCVKLQELFVGCSTTDVQGAVNVPLSCRVQLTAYNGQEVVVGTQSFTSTPTNPLLSDMTRAVVQLPPAKVIFVNATILDLPGGLGTAVVAALFDNVTYIQYDSSATGINACGSGF